MRVIKQFSSLRDIIRGTGRVKITDEEIKSVFDICDGDGQKLYVYIFKETELIFVMKDKDNRCSELMDFRDLISEVKSINEKNINDLKETIDNEESELRIDKLDKKLQEHITKHNHLNKMEEHMNEISKDHIKSQEDIEEEDVQISYDVIDGVYFPKMELPLTERELESVVFLVRQYKDVK